jgi:S1-C subfamily serine protease
MDAGLAAEFGLKDTRGVLVAEVTPDSPAARGGLLAGDVVTAFNDKAVSNRDELRLLVAQLPPGTQAGLQVVREGRPLVLQVRLGQLADAPQPTAPASVELFAGVQVAPVTDQLKRDFALESDSAGVVVTAVDRRSAYAVNLPVGTVIEKINKVAVTDVRVAKDALRRGRNTIVVRYGGTRRFISVDWTK